MKIPRNQLIVIIILIFPSLLAAQRFQIGIQSSLNLSNTHVINKEDFTDQKRVYYPLLLPNVNAYLGYKSESFWGFSLEPGFIQKGGLQKDITIISEGTMYQSQDLRYISNFLQLPILADFYLTDRLSISIGPEFSFFLSSKAKGEHATFNTSDDHDQLEVSGIIGIKYSLLKFLEIGLRYNHGINSPSSLMWIDDFGSIVDFSKQYYQYSQFTLRIKKNWR